MLSQVAQDVFTEVRNRGVIVIASAGNEGTADPLYPAAYAGVVSVSAVDIGKTLASYSSFGATIDVAAPGGDLLRDINSDGYGDGVLSTWADTSIGVARPTYAFVDGTSMAAPQCGGGGGPDEGS